MEEKISFRKCSEAFLCAYDLWKDAVESFLFLMNFFFFAFLKGVIVESQPICHRNFSRNFFIRFFPMKEKELKNEQRICSLIMAEIR